MTAGLEMPGQDPLDRAPYLLMSLVEKAIALGETVHPAHIVDRSEPALQEVRENFESYQNAMIEALSIAIKEARAYRATQDKPSTIEEGINRLAAAQKMFEQLCASYIDALDVWQRADALKSRIRLHCVEALMQGGEDSPPMPYTRADKEASQHPDYTEHKDRCVELARVKTEAEVEMKIAEEAVRNARAMVQGIITQTQVNIVADQLRMRYEEPK